MKDKEKLKLSKLGKIHKLLLGKYHLKSSRFIHLIKSKVNWMFPTLFFLIKNHDKKDKRLLLIWDLSVSPYAVGELIVLHEMAQILRLKYKVDKIDFCFVCDPKKPTGDYPGITSDNFYTKLPNLVSTIYLNPHIGNFFIFDSNKDLEHFISSNIERYYVWPDFKKYIAKHYPDRDNFDFIQKFYIDNGYIPYLDYRKNSLKWAYNFYKKYVFPKFPIVIQLRNNPHPSKSSINANLEEWLKFLKNSQKKFKNIKFVLIGAKEEIDKRFKKLPNVLVAKDYDTTVEQDMILAATSLIYVGTSSGPNVMAWFSKKPYIVFGYKGVGNEMISLNEKISFATKNQILNWEIETEKKIMEQFSDIYSKINKNKWKKEIEKYSDKKKAKKL